MSKIKTFFQCQSCGYGSPKWIGKCPDCGSWNSFVEEKAAPPSKHAASLQSYGKPEAVYLHSIEGTDADRTTTGIKEFDRVLGGGVVPGSVILVGGDPGIGKSTLLLQAFSGLSKKAGKLLYVSGEESPQQIKMRADRLSVNSGAIILLPETSLEGILDSAAKISPGAMVVDSIQTMYTQELLSAPGSVGQVRECAARLMLFAKRSQIPVFIVGHVTRRDYSRTPCPGTYRRHRTLFRGGQGAFLPARILRTIKNRFGSTNEIGIFEMSDAGLREVDNPSELFLSERPERFGLYGCREPGRDQASHGRDTGPRVADELRNAQKDLHRS